MMNWYLVLLFSFLGSKKKVPVENKTWSNAEMDWDNEQICHWLTARGLGEYVQVLRGMFVNLGITGKELSAFGSFTYPFGEGKRGGALVSNSISIFIF
jgi:hypothetical protein